MKPAKPDAIYVGTALLGVVFAAEAARDGAWCAAAVTALIATGALLYGYWKRAAPREDPPLVEVTETEAVIRQPMHIPLKVDRVPLRGLANFAAAGPKHDRRFRFTYTDGACTHLRPYYDRKVEEELVTLLRQRLPRLSVDQYSNAGLLERARGCFWPR
jgi:hypothetical protein